MSYEIRIVTLTRIIAQAAPVGVWSPRGSSGDQWRCWEKWVWRREREGLGDRR